MTTIVTYQHDQEVAESVWTVVHNLNTYPIVDVVVDHGEARVKIIPKDVKIIDMNSCEIHFSQPRTGHARLV